MERNKNFEADWFVFQRLQDVSSARRINLIRVTAVLMFFALVAWNYFSAAAPTAAETAHLWSVARLCGAWMLLAAALLVLLKLKVFPPIINYLTTICDVLLLTAVASLGRGDEPELEEQHSAEARTQTQLQDVHEQIKRHHYSAMAKLSVLVEAVKAQM